MRNLTKKQRNILLNLLLQEQNNIKNFIQNQNGVIKYLLQNFEIELGQLYQIIYDCTKSEKQKEDEEEEFKKLFVSSEWGETRCKNTLLRAGINTKEKLLEISRKKDFDFIRDMGPRMREIAMQKVERIKECQ